MNLFRVLACSFIFTAPAFAEKAQGNPETVPFAPGVWVEVVENTIINQHEYYKHYVGCPCRDTDFFINGWAGSNSGCQLKDQSKTLSLWHRQVDGRYQTYEGSWYGTYQVANLPIPKKTVDGIKYGLDSDNNLVPFRAHLVYGSACGEIEEPTRGLCKVGADYANLCRF